MSIQLACNTQDAVTHDFGRPKCPRCGSILLIAEESQFNLSRIRHAWTCDDCGHEFVTSIALYPR